MGKVTEYQGPGFFLENGGLIDLKRDLPAPGQRQPQQPQRQQARFSAASEVKPQPRPKTLLEQAQERVHWGLSLGPEHQKAFDHEMHRKVSAGLDLTMAEERRYIEWAASLDTDFTRPADDDEKSFIDWAVNL